MTDAPQINSQLLTPARLAWVMGVSHSTVDEWVRRREIASFKKGKLRRFEPGAVLEFICRHTVKEKFAQRSLVATLTNSDWERIERLVAEAVTASRRDGESARAETPIHPHSGSHLKDAA